MKIIKLILCAAGLSLLVSCSNTQMAVTGLALAGAATGYMAYEWMNNPDASNAYDNSPAEVITAVNKSLKDGGYTVIKTDTNDKDSTHLIEAQDSQGKKVNVAVSPVENNKNQAKVYIKGTTFGGISKAQSQILLNKINKNLKV